MAYVKVPGIDWFLHGVVAEELMRTGRLREAAKRIGNGIKRFILDNAHVAVVFDGIPLQYDHGSQSFAGGWSERISDQGNFYDDVLGRNHASRG